MDQDSSENEPQSASKANENPQDIDDDIDLTEINQLEAILSNAGSEKVRMLEFERQMFIDTVSNDSLVICGK